METEEPRRPSKFFPAYLRFTNLFRVTVLASYTVSSTLRLAIRDSAAESIAAVLQSALLEFRVQGSRETDRVA